MAIKSLEQTSRFDALKWVLVCVLGIAGFVANYVFINQPSAFRLIGWLLLVCICGLIAFQTQQGKRLWVLFCEARTEMHKVVWPTRQETVQATLIVVVMVVLVALFLWGVDSFLMWAIGFLTVGRG